MSAQAVFAIRRRRGALGDFPVGRVMTAQVALLAIVVAALSADPFLRVVSGAVAVLLLLVVSIRIGGRWWPTQLRRRAAVRSRRLAARRAMATATRSGDPRLVALAALAPGAAIREHHDRGSDIGIGQDEHGWYCALVVAPFSSMDGTRRAAFTLDRLARVFTETSVPVSRLQVVSCVLPAPTQAVGSGAPLVQSYRELLGSDAVQADQALWVALRLAPADAADAAASRGGGLDGVHRALATSIARVGKALSEVDVPYRILDGLELLDAVSGASGGAATPGTEQGRFWQSSSLAQVCYEVTEWPSGRPTDFLAGFSRLPALLVSVSVLVSPADGEVGLRGLIRIGAPAAGIAQAGKAVEDLARQGGGRVRRLDDEHGPAVYATCPTGGGA
ncbi:type VII secretion protein EccE [Dactylosporangium sp. CS-047395]|uniref:type VII secretion protein EccE n=1 Tax=Dactylosporangium sp. CS-047395 TaxID=3239936 RepID=UPI003D89ED1B